MKKMKSVISVIMTICMLIAGMSLPVSANESTSTEAGESMGIDFDYAEKNNIKSVNDALVQVANDNFTQESVYKDNYVDSDNPYKWVHIEQGDFKNSGGKLREVLESDKPEHKYIVLDENIESRSGHTDYDEITIKSDKVIDLNGYTWELDDIRNKVDRPGALIDKYYQSKTPTDHRSIMITIEKGATVTIIDSSAKGNEEGTGKIINTGYMINPFKHPLIFNTTRDVFWVNDGNLVVYGGTIQAGRQKDYCKSNFSWDKFKDTVGHAVELGVAVADYATGIKGAMAAKDDLNEAIKKAEETLKEDDDGTDGTNGKGSSTQKKDGEGTKKEPKSETPSGNKEGETRDTTVAEKKEKKNEEIKKENEQTGGDRKEEGDNKADAEEVAKNKNTSLAKAEKDIVNSIVNKDSITSMVDSGFKLVEGIISMIGEDEKTRVTESIQGTAVHLGNKGTFVAYGGKFIGYGSTPNTRNAVIEVTRHADNDINEATGKLQGGQAYIYGGTFEGYTGANIFNFVHANPNTQTVIQSDQDQYGNRTSRTVTLQPSETMGLEIMYFENPEAVAKNGAEPIPVNTSNVVVRGGTFRNYYEYFNAATGEEDGNYFRRFPGTSGFINLGVESYGKDFIRDGRIQIVDSYGDGALVLMDDRVDEEGKSEGIYHYRLYCSDTELRYNRYLQVYPNKSQTNSTHSMKLETYYGSGEQESMKYWVNDEENVREAPYGNDEYYFSFPIDNKELTEKYYVAPNLTNTDVYGENLANSEVWYYNDPVDTQGEVIPDIQFGIDYMAGTNRYFGDYVAHSLVTNTGDRVKTVRASLNENSIDYYQNVYDSYKTDLTWFTYKIYRVDPLTRENLSESEIYGVDEPLAEVVYGTSNNSLKCKLDLKDIEAEIIKRRGRDKWQGYQQGELYRIVFTVEEHLNFDFDGVDDFDKKLDVAKAESTVLFRCYSINEKKDDGSATYVEDYTPLQWINEPKIGQYAMIQIVNGKAGQIDYLDNKIFDVYYQWWEVDKDGKPVKLLAGTTNVYDGDHDGKRYHHYTMWKVGTDGHTYVNTVDPKDPNAKTYNENGMPKDQNDWNCDILHAYTNEMTPESYYTGNNGSLALKNNKIHATNMDECYIPESCAGKRIRVKAIAVNTKWTKVYDKKQVFYSHVVEIPETRDPLTGSVSTKFDGEFATYENPVTLTLEGVTGLTKTEKITDIIYSVNGRKFEKSKLSLTATDKMPTAQYPRDFYAEGTNLETVGGRDCKVEVTYKTSGDRTFTTNVEFFRYELEAKALEVLHDVREFDLSKKGIGETNLRPILPLPHSASIGFNYASATVSDKSVAYINNKGYAVLAGKTGESIITMTGPDGNEYSVTLKVIDRFDSLEVFGIDAPVVGQKFDLTAEVPADAKYYVKDVYWSVGYDNEKVATNAVVGKYKNYKVNVVLEGKPGCSAASVAIPSKFTVNLSDGSTDTISANLNMNGNHFNINGDGTYTFSYQFKALGEIGTKIDKVFIDFPTEVQEGDSVSKWAEQVKVYASNDLDLSFTTSQTFSADAFNILAAYGYNNVTTDTFNTFVQGVQTGPYFSIDIPEGIDLEFAEKVTVYVNGSTDRGQIEYKYSDSFTYGSYNSINISKGNPLADKPEYAFNDFDLVAGETLNVDDLLETDDQRVSVDVVKITSYDFSDSNVPNYIENDAENRQLIVKQATSGDDEVNVQFNIYIDLNFDDEWDVQYTTIISKPIYASRADVPAKPDEGTYTLKVLDPEGNELSSQKVNCGESVLIPEYDDLFVAGYEINGRSYEISNLNPIFPASNGATIKIKTVYADHFDVNTSDTSLFADCEKASMLDISIDGIHWIRRSDAGCHINNLKPDTEYTVFYRQGTGRKVYARKVKTAKTTYGVYVGRTPVTPENTGILVRDGWQYDPTTKTLTLQNANITTGGTIGASAGLLSVTLALDAAIYAEDDITINLIGDNKIFKEMGDSLMQSVIYSKGDITFTGNGNLTLHHNASIFGYTAYAEGSIYFNSTGKITATDASSVFEVGNGQEVVYRNGEINIVGVKSNTIYACSLAKEFKIAADAHNPKFYTSDTSSNKATTEVSKDQLLDGKSKGAIRIVPTHAYTKDVKSLDAFKSGNCEAGATYYKSCECGAVSDNYTFTSTACDHDLVKHDGKTADCLEDGWKEFYTCNNCDFNNFTAIKATGHDWTVHEEITATCKEYGAPAFAECSKCDASSQIVDKTMLEELGYGLVEHDIYMKGVTPPTAEKDGLESHYECSCCGEMFVDEAGMVKLTPAAITIPKAEYVNYAPEAVTNLKVKQVSYKEVKLTWNASALATEYDVFMKSYKEGATYKLSTTVTGTSAKVSGLMTGKDYTFYVAAKNNAGASEASSEVKFATKLTGTVTLAIEPVGKTQFKLSWNKIDGATRYIVYRKRDDDKMKKVLTLGSNDTTYTTAEMPHGNYQFILKAGRYDSKDRVMTDASNTVKGSVAKTKPSVTLTAGKKQVKVAWKALKGVTHYEVYRATSSGGTYKKLTTTKELSYTAKSLSSGKKYYFKVRGYKNYKSGDTIQYNVYTDYSSVKYATAK